MTTTTTTGARLALAALTLTLWACGPGISEEDLATLPSDYEFDNTALTNGAILRLRSEWSPANPIPTAEQVRGPDAASFSTDFNFCHDAPRGEFDLNQAAWMAFFSANVYSHLGYAGPQLHGLGFTNPAGGDNDWAQCGLDLETMTADEGANLDLFEAARGHEILRSYVQTRFIDNDRWGACAGRWFNALEEDGTHVFDGTALPAASFISWLLQRPTLENYVQFACGGSWNFDQTEYDEGSTQGVVIRRARDPVSGAPPVVIVAFRGTQPTEWMDVSVDLALFKTDLETDERADLGWGPGWGKVHRGFFNAYMSIDAQARAFAQYFLALDDPPQIYITGHSLGGALATILASRILQAIESQEAAGQPMLDLRGVYTFGSPRVGNPTFVTHFNEMAARYGVTVGRVRNDDDAVTNVPRIEFDHVGPMFQLIELAPGSVDADIELTRYDDMATEPSSALGSAADHNIGGYLYEHDDDRASATFNTATYDVDTTGYYRRLREAYEGSLDPTSPLATWNHCD